MKLQIERAYVEALVREFPELAPLQEQLKFDNKAEWPCRQLAAPQLACLHSLYAAAGAAMQGRAAQLATLQRAVHGDGKRYQEGELERLVPDITEFLIRDGIRGWLFKANNAGKPLAFLLARIDYTPPGEEEAGRILLDLKANSMAKVATVNLMIRERDMIGQTLPEMLAAKGFFNERPELITAYDRSAERYFAWRADYGWQFSGRGTGIVAEDPTATHRKIPTGHAKTWRCCPPAAVGRGWSMTKPSSRNGY